MTPPEHVLCCVVNDVMQHLTTLGSVTPPPSPYRRDAENKAELSGVIVRVADVTSAAIGFHEDPDSTHSLVLSEPVFISDPTTEKNAACFRKMLSAVIRHAAQHDFSQIRFLNWESGLNPIPWIARELALAGFSAAASVVGWKTTAEECLHRPPPVPTVRLSAADLPVSDPGPGTFATPGLSLPSNQNRNKPRYEEITEALDRILENSHDLIGLDTPTANDLLRKWSSQECTLLVAETEREVAGLCAFAFKPSGDSDSTASGRIEYLGVRQEMQRQGIATQMLSYLCRGVSRGSRQTIEITAYADENNVPANTFYRHSGFEPLCRGKIWLHGVSRHTKRKEPS